MSLEYYSFIACILQSKWFEGLDLVGVLPPCNAPLPSTGWGASAWDPPGNPWKTIKIPTCSQDPQKSEKVSSRPPTNSKMTPKTLPPDINLVNKWKKWNHSKTIVFYYGLNTYSHCILASFPSLDHQKHGPRNCFPLWHPKSKKNHKKVSKVSPKSPPKLYPKINKNGHLDLKVPVGCPCGPLDHHNGPQDTKMEPQGL